MPETDAGTTELFIAKWRGVTASELSTSQSFLLDLCRLLEVPEPHATVERDYLFERSVTFQHGDGSTSAGRIDLYRRGAFVLESKKLRNIAQPRGVDEALLRARSQAEEYARALPSSEGRPPFVIVVDVGSRIELYSEFSRSGATYIPFPDPRSHRIELAELARPEIRDRLRRIWLEPLSLDPSRESARVTLDIARQLANLARSLEISGHLPQVVAQFLMRCLFTMFAEDVQLLPAESFRNLLLRHAQQPDVAMRMLSVLWQEMDGGGFSAVLAGAVLRFNGKLFKHTAALPLDKEQLTLLIEAARADWKHVEPAIFGTLLERALSPIERHQLGAHFTPRAYVERLVLPTVIEPLRAEWSDAQAAALTLAAEGKSNEAITELRRFHRRLCAVRVLDPACGSGNFLYVALEHLKRLEGEVLNSLDELGWRQTGLALDGERADATGAETVDPHNLLGIELNPRAAEIAEVVLWIGYLQWHFRTRGNVNPPEPVIRDFRNIECRDAVLAYDNVEQVLGEDGRLVTRWDGRTMKASPVTGEEIPDETARLPLERYVNPRKAEWPDADFVVGNPPFIGTKRLKIALGDGYVAALRNVWDDVPESADLVMYWWHKAAQLVQAGALRRFGLITTNSIKQTFNRRVIQAAIGDNKKPLSLVFAIPDHPWVDTADGAAVRIAMTVADGKGGNAVLREVVEEYEGENEVAVTLREKRGLIFADLKIGANVVGAARLLANDGLCWQGVKLVGDGFLVAPSDQDRLSAAGPAPVKPYLSNKDLVQRRRNLMVIDFHGCTAVQARAINPLAFQRVLDRVKPLRDQNAERSRRDNWWLFGRSNEGMREAIAHLGRFIVTPEVAKFRPFCFVSPLVPDASLYVVGSDDGFLHGILSSEIHQIWALAAGGDLEDRPRYHNTNCFDRFPFPSTSTAQQSSIRSLAEQLDAHRQRQQAAHPELTLTGMYNVLEKLRSGASLTATERTIHDHGLVSILRQLHEELDAAVLDGYGWSDLRPLLRVAHGDDPIVQGETREDAGRSFYETILERLVALNTERAAEEARGLVRWLRPAFQDRGAKSAPLQAEMDTETKAVGESAATVAGKVKPKAWPKDPLDQVRAVAEVLTVSPNPLSVDDVAARFTSRGPWKKRVGPLLEMLVALGRAREKGGLYRTRR